MSPLPRSPTLAVRAVALVGALVLALPPTSADDPAKPDAASPEATVATPAASDAPPSRPGIDAPELAAPGAFEVGVRTLDFTHAAQLNAAAFDAKTGVAPRQDRRLVVTLWYPGRGASPSKPTTYADSMDAEPPAPPAKFEIPGLAVEDMPAAAGRFPLVVVSHGYGNVPVAMSWLGENLASKGYVVAAIRHADEYLNPAGLPQALLRRPLDIAYVTRELHRTLGSERMHDAPQVDAARTALVGYSMGGYGVLAAGGAVLEASGPLAGIVPGGLLQPYARGGPLRADAVAPSVRAIVALAPGGGAIGAWGARGLQGITAPLLLISGDRDLTVPYESGARAFFDAATASPNRYLLTFRNGGHALGLGPAPAQMRTSLWNQDWFEDPVWRKDRLTAIILHFVTAFLDRYVRDDASRAAYIDGLVEDSSKGEWQAPPATPWGARSPGGDGITLWKGFQRRHAEGLTLQHAGPAQRSTPAN